MDAVMLVEQLDSHGHAVLRQRLRGRRRRVPHRPRPRDCDIVVDDEHAAPQHALLTLQEDGRVRVQRPRHAKRHAHRAASESRRRPARSSSRRRSSSARRGFASARATARSRPSASSGATTCAGTARRSRRSA